MNTVRLEIVTPQKEALSQDVQAVSVPTPTGIIQILPTHIPLVTVLTEGEIKVLAGGKETYFAIGGGFMQVTKKSIIILVSRAVHADELNENEIKKAQENAKIAFKQKGTIAERADAQALLRRSLLELKVLRHRKRRSGPNEAI